MKKRIPYLLSCLVLIALGIALRTFTASLPMLIANYLPDVVWACALYCFIGMVLAKSPLWHGPIALVIAFAIEFLQRYQATWIVNLRSSIIGQYLLGTGFLWSDLICYAVGIAVCFAVDFLLWKRTPKVRPSKYRK